MTKDLEAIKDTVSIIVPTLFREGLFTYGLIVEAVGFHFVTVVDIAAVDENVTSHGVLNIFPVWKSELFPFRK